nr:RNA-directed DNA polymerase, eukaryota [Tanacetum cinerariifolium]
MSKASKRLVFVRFIKVDDIARLIRNLCTLWVGRYHLHANVVRYERPSKPHQTSRFPHYNDHSPPGSYVAVFKDYKSKNNTSNSSPYTPALVLEDSCSIVRDLSRRVMGKVKDLNSIPNLLTLLTKEGFPEVKLSYLEGMWVLIELVNVATKMKLLQHTGVNSWFNVIQAAKHDFVTDERVVWVDIEGIPLHVWSRDTFMKIGSKWGVTMDIEENLVSSFAQSDYVSDDESFHGANNKSGGLRQKGVDFDDDSHEEGVSETLFGDKTSSPRNSAHKGEDYVAVQQPEDPHHSEDPFGVYELLHKKPKEENNHNPVPVKKPVHVPVTEKEKSLCVQSKAMSSSQENIDKAYPTGESSFIKTFHNGGSVLEVLDDMIRVEQSMGYDMQVYDPQSTSLKRVLWEYSSSLIAHWKGETISHPLATKMSKLDRFLVSEGIISLFPSLSALCLDCHLSDHRPILLNEIHTDYGPVPFRVYHSWFKREGFDDMVKLAWNSFSHSYSNQLIKFKKNLQDLKVIIRGWIKDKKSQFSETKNAIIEDLIGIDKYLDNGIVSDELLLNRMELTTKLQEHNQIEAKDFAQQAKIKWAIEGDKNSKFFHVEDLERVITKDEIRVAVWGCGENKSPGPDGGKFSKGNNASFIALIPKVTNAKFVTDFRPISMIGSVYKVVTKILANRLSLVISDLVSDTQSAFVANRQILDGPFIMNELLAWCKRKRKHALIFKVDFAKAYDSVRWDYLLDVLHAFGFGPNWCKWIQGTFTSAMASIFVNGSPTAEFPFFRGLKQDDPLSPFLFILVMESLHLSVSRAVSEGVFKGIQLHGSMSISYLFYANDAVFIGEWSDVNLMSLVRILNCFYLASGLKINLQKSQVLGVGVSPNFTNHGVSLIGYGVMRTPFRYLGVSVGVQMSRNSAWANTIQKLHSRLSRWKVKTLSLESIITLIIPRLGVPFFERLGCLPRKTLILSLIARNVLGMVRILGFGQILGSRTSLYAPDFLGYSLSNKIKRFLLLPSWALLQLIVPFEDRWFCDLNGEGAFRVKDARSIIDDIFVPSSEVATRWVKYIPIKINIFMWRARLDRSVGGGILIGKTFRPFLIRMVDLWFGEEPLCTRYNRLFRLDVNEDCLLSERFNEGSRNWQWLRPITSGRTESKLHSLQSELDVVTLSSFHGSWKWHIGNDGSFSVASTRTHIDHYMLSLSHRQNLSKHGIEIGSILCPICNNNMESAEQIFFSCEMVAQVWHMIHVWCNIDLATPSYSDWRQWLDNVTGRIQGVPSNPDVQRQDSLLYRPGDELLCEDAIRSEERRGHLPEVRGAIPAVLRNTEKHHQENKEDYRWTKEAEHAFPELKKFILELPTLTTPELKETLFIYLATSHYAMNGEFIASNEWMTSYLAKAKEQVTLFKKFSIKNIPRNQNQKVDVLSKLASVAFNHLTKEILVEVLNSKSVDVQEGLDILGPLPEGPGKLKFIIVAIDYFTKWIEAKPLAKTTDNGTQLVNDPFKNWCEKWKIKQINTAVAHPQANDLVERANKSLVGLKQG